MQTIPAERYIAEFFAANRVTHFFYVPVILFQAIKEMTALGILPVAAHSEKAAAYMADGYARATGRPGICGAQTIGGTNLASGLRDALQAHSPVIAISGGKDRANIYRGTYQEIDDMPIYEALTKFNVTVHDAERWSDLLPAAFRAATTGSPAPVHIECSGLAGEQVMGEIARPLEIGDGFSRCPAARPSAARADIASALELVARAERPVIIAGGGVWTSDAGDALLAFARKLSLPVATSLNGKGLISDADPLAVGVAGVYSRSCANRAIHEADLVIFAGTRGGALTTTNWQLPPRDRRIIHIDIDPQVIGSNYPRTLGLCGDVRAVLEQMSAAADDAPPRRAKWCSRIDTLKRDWAHEAAPAETSDAVPLRPERLCRELSDRIPEDAVIVGDTGHAGMWIAQNFHVLRDGQRFMRAAGSLGWGLPAAIGAKCGLPDRPVICFTGDGGFLIHMAELETAIRYGINLVVVINNNQGLSQEEILWRDDPAWDRNWKLAPVDYVALAESMGCLGLRVTQPDEIGPALDAALAADRPVVIDAVSDARFVAPLAWTPPE